MNKALKVTALLCTLALVSCGNGTSSSEYVIYTPSVPYGDMSSDVFFSYGNYLETYSYNVTHVEKTAEQTLASLGLTSHSVATTDFYNGDILETIISEDQDYESYPSVHLDITEQTYIRDLQIHFIHDEGTGGNNYRISKDYNDGNYTPAYYTGFPKSYFSYFSNAGTHYSDNELLRSGITNEDGVSLYLSYVKQETSTEYGYRLDLEVAIVGSYIVSATIDERYYQDEAIILSNLETVAYSHELRVDFPSSHTLLDYTLYSEQSA